MVVVNKREVTYFMLKEGNALTPAAWDPRRGSCSHTLVTARCMLCCTSMRNVFCIHAETGDGQGGEVYWELLLYMRLPPPGQESRGQRRLWGGSSSCLPWAPVGHRRGCMWGMAPRGPLVLYVHLYALVTSSPA